jgi:exodeoxyribonuclease V beta subunit
MKHHESRILDISACLDLPLLGVKLIEASAGTGKTYTIGNLYLRYVAAGYRVSEILVVTFTNAATEELRGRIRKRLFEGLSALENGLTDKADPFLIHWSNECLGQDQAERDKTIALLKLAVRTMDEAAIYTIHGFCQRVLTDHAFDSGQAFSLELIDDDSQMWDAALRDWWRKTTYVMDTDAVALFDESVGSYDAFVNAQITLRNGMHREKLPGSISPLNDLMSAGHELLPEVQKLQKVWLSRSAKLKQFLLDSKALGRGKTTDFYKPTLEVFFQIIDRFFANESLSKLPAEFRILSAAHILQCNTPSKKGSDDNLDDEFFHACQKVWDRLGEISSQIRMAALIEANDFALAHVDGSKRENNTLAFSDQLSRVLDGLQRDSGAALAQNLRSSFPIAMIDEFQDTDNIQYGIFRAIYLSIGDDDEQAKTAMIMIGDPKQAIYSFRGGDIFAYAEAKRDVGDALYTLDTNWRSVPRLINAVNAIFSMRDEAFVYADAVDFQPVSASDKDHALLTIDGQEDTPLSLWRLPLDESDKPLSKEHLRGVICEAVAGQVAELLAGAQTGSVKLGDKALQAGDIAILVRSNNEGQRMRRALFERGVDAVAAGKNRVFETEEAAGLDLILDGIVHSDDRRRFRSALGSSLLALSYAQIAAIVDDADQSVQWQEKFKALKVLWLNKGFMAMFYVMLEQLHVGLKLAQGDLAERRLTNILHIAELLQQNSKIYPGFEALMSWYQEQLKASGQEAELRLESDQDLVKIVTIHASKGLEYRVVFVPFLWDCRHYQGSFSGTKILPFHDASGKAFLDLGDSGREDYLLLADKERLAEDIRLLYVALTRAQAKLYLVWGNGGNRQFNDSPRSALAWLLHSARDSQSLTKEYLKEDLSLASVSHGLDALAEEAAGTIGLDTLPMTATGTQLVEQLDKSPTLDAVRFTGSIAHDWRISSFSSLTRDVHQPALGRSASAAGNDAILEFEAGSHVGLFLHHLLEDIDFTTTLDEQVAAKIKQYAPQFALEDVAEPGLITHWISDIVHTPLNDSGLSLAEIPQAKRLNELSFDFGIGRLDLVALNDTLSRWAGEKLQPVGYETITGMITGVIDLIFEHDGRFFVADYKSNYLGGSLEAYRPDNLRKAIFARRYDLQYLLYVLALHRYLRQRIADYDYSKSMGGVYYLFLRGMRPGSGAQYGVYFDLPPLSLIEDLDLHIFGLPSLRREGMR